MPAQQRLRRHEATASVLHGEQPGQRREHGAVWPARAWPGDLPAQHRTSCRSTRTSAFLDACPRASNASQPMSWQKIR
jgi:hypothetical protein